MQFKHPEILYFLTLLLVPILVHLFQLQKFKKTPFTNVAFLQKILLQNRKSSQLKKWLILMCRLLLFSGLIIAFSQPYFSNENSLKKQANFIYLDNSLSMSSQGKKGELFQNAIQEIIENSFENESYNLLTNSNFYKNLNALELKNILLKLQLDANSMTFESVILKIKEELRTKINTLSNVILISDFQLIKKEYANIFTNVTQPISLIKLITSEKNNISIDSLTVHFNNDVDFTIEVLLKNQGKAINNIPVSIFNNTNLISKQAVSLIENETKRIFFPIQNTKKFNGKISLEINDAFLFDNSFFFTVNDLEKINVLSIGNSSKFLSKIYTNNEFEFSEISLKNINYNLIEKQQLIILNELTEIPASLTPFLKNFTTSGGSLVIIPNTTIQTSTYDLFLKELGLKNIHQHVNDSLRITNINFKHPFFNQVFEKSVSNFQYPFSKNNHIINDKNLLPLVSFENEAAFIAEFNAYKIYWVAASLSTINSNFNASPLIVPIFYNFGVMSMKNQHLYYTIGNNNTIDISAKVNKDEVLSIQNNKNTFIPPQQSYPNKVRLKTTDTPNEAGIYFIKNDTTTLRDIAFNINKDESLLQFFDMNSFVESNKYLTYHNAVSDVLQENNKKNKVTWLWKWFLGLAIVSLFFEILILKLFKP